MPIPAAPKPLRRPNHRLPERFQNSDIWTKYMVPTAIKWAGTQPRIFKPSPKGLAQILEIAARYYFDDDEIRINEDDAAVGQVCFH